MSESVISPFGSLSFLGKSPPAAPTPPAPPPAPVAPAVEPAPPAPSPPAPVASVESPPATQPDPEPAVVAPEPAVQPVERQHPTGTGEASGTMRVALADPRRKFVNDPKPARTEAPAPEDDPGPYEDADDEAEDAEEVEQPAAGAGGRIARHSFVVLDARDTAVLGLPAVRLDGELPEWCEQRPHSVVWSRAGWWTDAFWPAPHEKVPDDVTLVAAKTHDPDIASDRWSVLHGQIISDHGNHVLWLLALGPNEDVIGVWRAPVHDLPDLLNRLTDGRGIVPDDACWTISRNDLDDRPAAERADAEPVPHDDEPEPDGYEDSWPDGEPVAPADVARAGSDEPPATTDTEDPLDWLDIDPYALDSPMPHISDDDAPDIGAFYHGEW